MLLQPPVALGRWVLTSIDGAAGFHQEWLEITLPPSICESLLMVGEDFFFIVSCFTPPSTVTEAGSCLPPPHTVNLSHCKGSRGGPKATALPVPPADHC